MKIDTIRQRLRALGAQPLHEQRVLRDWVRLQPHDQGRRRAVDFLPKAVREALPALDAELHAMAQLISTHPSDDGSARLLVGLVDGQSVETVLLPRAPRLTPRELVEHGERYARLTGYPVQYQWTLLEGVNDGMDEMDGIVELLKDKHAVLNMIPYNTIPDLAFKRPSWERARALAAALHERGVLTKLRDSAGQDVDGGCGQLRARAADLHSIRIHRA